MKNVLVTATTFPRWKGDPEPGFVYFLSNSLAKRNYHMSILVPHFFRAKKFEKMDSVYVYRFKYFPEKFQKVCYDGGIIPNFKKYFSAKMALPFMILFELINIKKIVKRGKINLIHAHWILPQGFLAAIIKKFYKTPYIVTVHGGDIFPLRRNKILRRLIKFVLKNCDYCTVNSSATKKAVLEICNIKNIELIPMGVDLETFSKGKDDNELKKRLGIEDKFLLTVGRLTEQKGIKYLLFSMKDVLRYFPKTKLVIIGDGIERENLERLTKKLNLENNIIFTGKIPNEKLPDYYASADIFVSPSIIDSIGWGEGMGIVFLESIAAGTPVIGSNVGGIPDIIKNNKTGLLIEQKNIPQIANAIKKILKDKNLGNKLVKQGKEHIKEKYSWENITKKFENIYSILGEQ